MSDQPKALNQLAIVNFERWNNALKSKDPENMLNIYSNDNTFLPTLLGEFKKGHKGVVEYFEHFMQKDPIGTILEDEVQALSEVAYSHSGHYQFELGPVQSRTIVVARFTFIWALDQNKEWKVLHHHSSLKP